MSGQFEAVIERLKKSWGWTTVAAVVVLVLVFAFWPRPVLVDTAEVVSGPMQVFVTDDGETRIHDIFRISAPLAGRVLRIASEVGDDVIAGETVVATLQQTDPTFLDVRSQSEREAAVRAAEAAVSLAEAEVGRARAEMDFAHADLERARGLKVGETISSRALQRAEVDVQTKKAALEEAQSMLSVRRYELETARAALILPGGEEGTVNAPCCIQLNSPTNGKVLQVLHKSEGVVAAGTPLLEIGDPSDLEIVVDLLSSDAVNVTEGARVAIDEWGGERMLNGRVRRVEPYAFTKTSALGIEEQRVNVVIDFTDSRESRRALAHGYRVVANIVVWEGDNEVQVPIGALFRVGEAWGVFAVEDGRARLKLVEIGRRNTNHAQVAGGLAPGDKVVLYPSDQISDGTRIKKRG